MKKLFIFLLLLTISTLSHAMIRSEFIRLPGGTFTMGSPGTEPGRLGSEIQRQVTVSPFYMSRFLVTQAEFEDLMGRNPSFFRGPNLPVERVSWFEAVEFANKLSLSQGLTPAYTISGNTVTWDRSANGFRLPTEAEWEFAGRGGTTTTFNTGNVITTDQANFDGTRPLPNHPRGIHRERTTPVGTFPPNYFGLYDMHGNVGEWCWDWHGAYAPGPQIDPIGAASGVFRVFRGGSWNSSASFVRSARRSGYRPVGRGNYLGFRLVRNAEPRIEN